MYWARKKIRNNVKIRLDLTKERHDVLLEANNLVEDNNDVVFCFVDINCRLKIKWEDELLPDSFLSSLEDLEGKLQVNENYNSFSFKFVVSFFQFIIGF